MVVVAQEAEAGAEDDRAQRRDLHALERGGEDGEGRARDADHPGGERVHPVDEVHQVGDQRDPENRERVGGQAEVEVADDRQADLLEAHPVAEDRDAGDGDDGEHLDAGRQAAQVVDQPDQADQRGADGDPEQLAVGLDDREVRDEDAGSDRQPADARDRVLVDARPVAVGLIDRADRVRQTHGDRREREDQRRGGDEAPDGSPVRDEPVDGVGERDGRQYARWFDAAGVFP